jgi:hypothetical protein
LLKPDALMDLHIVYVQAGRAGLVVVVVVVAGILNGIYRSPFQNWRTNDRTDDSFVPNQMFLRLVMSLKVNTKW